MIAIESDCCSEIITNCSQAVEFIATRWFIMNAEDFRRIALSMEGAIEDSHMGHPDFRAHGRIFATLHSDRQWGMVKLTPDQQQAFVRQHPDTYAPENGAWGRAGSTKVRLDHADGETLETAITLAWQNTLKKRGVRA